MSKSDVIKPSPEMSGRRLGRKPFRKSRSRTEVNILDIFKALSFMMQDFRRETKPQAKAPRPFSDSEKLDDDNKLIVRAMIAFAAADGRVDLSERDRVLMQLGALGLSDRDTRFIMQEFQAPADLDEILSNLHLAESRDILVKRIRAMTDPSNPDEVVFLSKVEGG